MFSTKMRELLLLLFISLVIFSCSKENDNPVDPSQQASNYSNHIKIIYTNDEHGWMLPEGEYGGAAAMKGLWEDNGYDENDDSYLILSGGDMWTGPAISTWFQGESMVEVMDAMGYDAAAIGNHEFDFGVEGLKQRMNESEFPFISCNIREKSTGNIPSFIDPYIIKTVDGIKIGIIGLSSISTPHTAFPKYVEAFNFIDYAEALNEMVPEVKAEGAELLFVVGHIAVPEMTSLISTAKELGIAVITGGHQHEEYFSISDGVALIESGSEMQNYVSLDVYYNSTTHSVVKFEGEIHPNIGGSSDQSIQSIVTSWQSKADAVLSEVIGYTDVEIGKTSPEMQNMVVDSWLYSFPDVDISLTNAGGIRQSIPAGDITIGTIVGLLPFQNTILQLNMSGNDVISSSNYLLFGGMKRNNGYFLSNGDELVASQTYDVLTTDYLYSIADYGFQNADDSPYNTSVLYRQPLIDWIKSINTSASNPLSNYLDFTQRQ